MLQEKKQNILDEIEVRTLLNVAIDADGEVLADREDEHMEGGQIRAVRAVGVGAVL